MKGAVKMICLLSSRPVKYLKRGADERPYEMCGRFSMHTTLLCISRSACSAELNILPDVQWKELPFLLPTVFCSDICLVVVLHYKILYNPLSQTSMTLHL